LFPFRLRSFSEPSRISGRLWLSLTKRPVFATAACEHSAGSVLIEERRQKARHELYKRRATRFGKAAQARSWAAGAFQDDAYGIFSWLINGLQQETAAVKLDRR
jgi:hypothetical protein